MTPTAMTTSSTVLTILMSVLPLLLVVIIVDWYISRQFANIAESKGHAERRWFWICFFFGLAGWLMVIALPDVKLQRLLKASLRSASTAN